MDSSSLKPDYSPYYIPQRSPIGWGETGTSPSKFPTFDRKKGLGDCLIQELISRSRINLQLDWLLFRHARQIISHRTGDSYGDNLTDRRIPLDKDHAVDLRRVAIRATDCNPLVTPFHQYIQSLSYKCLIDLQRNALLQLHQTLIACLLHLRRDRVAKGLTGRPRLEGELECTHAVKAGLLHKINQCLIFLLCLTWIANNECSAD